MGLTQAEAARLLGAAMRTYQGWESVIPESETIKFQFPVMLAIACDYYEKKHNAAAPVRPLKLFGITALDDEIGDAPGTL